MRNKKGQFVKGFPPENKGRGTFKKHHKGLLNHPNQTSFKKGNIPWCKGKKGLHLSPKTEFKVDNIPWIFGKNIWKGTRSEYKKLHYWVYKQFGKPIICIKCNSKKDLVWANKSQKYLKRKSDWISLCRKCHTKKDSDFMKNGK